MLHTIQCDPYRLRYSDGDSPPGVYVASFKVSHASPMDAGQLRHLLPGELHLNAAGLDQLR